MVTCRSGSLSASILTLILLGACDAPPPGTQAAGANAGGNPDCVTLADGLYESLDGRLLAVTAGSPGAAPLSGWQGAVQSTFAGLGFPWMGLNVRGRVAALTGTAPDADAKAAALSAAEAAIAANPEAATAGLLIVDAISVAGGERGVGESVTALANSGVNLESCQRAFIATMAGGNIQFESGNARISPVSARLLDAVTGVATLCNDFVVEIGSHTDSRGADDFNLSLSQERADAVLAYLIGKGVSEDNLLSVGYGETVPLDPAPTPEAYEQNRRTEFKVIAR